MEPLISSHQLDAMAHLLAMGGEPGEHSAGRGLAEASVTEAVAPISQVAEPSPAASPPCRRRVTMGPPLYRAPAPPEWRRARLRISGLPRVPGLNHDSAEGRAYRRHCLDLIERACLSVPLPGSVLGSLREAARLRLDLDRLQAAEASEQCTPAPRQQELRRLRSEQRRVRAQILSHERVVLAIAAEQRAATRQAIPSVRSLLDRVGRG